MTRPEAHGSAPLAARTILPLNAGTEEAAASHAVRGIVTVRGRVEHKRQQPPQSVWAPGRHMGRDLSRWMASRLESSSPSSLTNNHHCQCNRSTARSCSLWLGPPRGWRRPRPPQLQARRPRCGAMPSRRTNSRTFWSSCSTRPARARSQSVDWTGRSADGVLPQLG